MKINAAFVEKILISFIKEELTKFNIKNGILGLSGGLDSTVSTFLAAKALGKNHVIAMIMPYGKTFSEDVRDAHEVAEFLEIRSKTIDISPPVDAYFSSNPSNDKILKGNKMARERMSILYDFSARENALIIGTSNKTELLLGYGTLHGDTACAINPIGDLYKTQIRYLGNHLDIPKKILKKPPSAGLWVGQRDEDELGLSYEEMDKILFQLVDKRKTRDELIASGFDRDRVDSIIQRVKKSEFKRKLPPIAKISERTVGHDFLYPYDWDK